MSCIANLVMRLMPLIFICCIILNTVFSLIPTTVVPGVFIFWDKAQHALSFATLAMTGSLAYPKKMTQICLGLIMYGAVIEIMQGSLTTTRYGDISDWIADGIGVVTGGFFIHKTRRYVWLRY